MIRIAFVVLAAAASSGAAHADGCRVTGTAYDADGRPLQSAVLRLVDLQTRQSAFIAADAKAGFSFDAVAPSDIGRYRIDVLSAPTVVTGSRIPTRSVLGSSPTFACGSGQIARQDVTVQAY
ncbi:carboxypeptidase-like regulatory domain-containing protein [Dokdonella sp.]|uniref:carboxypeptidase-like regulatory domain-containing protein n=1 Tax=Dokdonella sp. TaxID=2291710 RepID=UPI002F3F5770